jgi:hypothetical protein
MTANNLSQKFLAWFQLQNPDAIIYCNNAGKFKINGRWISFGEGGSDFIAFMPYEVDCGLNNSAYCRKGIEVQFYKIKTAKDKMSKSQINFANMIIEMGGDYYIVHEMLDCKDFCLEKWRIINLKNGEKHESKIF